MPLTIRPASILSPEVGALIDALNVELDAIYPEPGANHFRLDPDEVAPGRGVFVVAYENGVPVGCGAVRLLSPDEAELKRMYVVPAIRRRGVARTLLHALEAEARRLGALRLVLEAGPRQVPAMTLYRQAGFTEIPRFGEYVDSPLSVCLAKQLT